MKIWQKTENQKINKLVEAFTVGNDHILDMQLMPYDIQASIAHAHGLQRIGILTQAELTQLVNSLDNLAVDLQAGKVSILLSEEDCHTYIENYLTKNLGSLGKKIHTGRSRNDQVLVAIQLYLQSNGKEIHDLAKKLINQLKRLTLEYKSLPFPGYSHTQQAMVTSLGHYFAGFQESLEDDADLLQLILKHISKNPLGSAAGFGSTLNLDRNFTTKELGFDKLQVNSLYCQNSRGKFHSLYLEALVQIMLTLGTLADDLILYTTKEFDYLKIADEFTTGSSIMPQKKNQDVLELVRGKVSLVIANQLTVKMLAKSLPSGYNRDFQLMKAPLFDSTSMLKQTLEVMLGLLSNISVNSEVINAKLTPEILSADIATELTQTKGIPFRDAYKLALQQIPKSGIDWQTQMQKHISLGAAGNLNTINIIQ